MGSALRSRLGLSDIPVVNHIGPNYFFLLSFPLDIARVVSASSRVLHIRDLDERISVENAAVMALAKKRQLVN
jgi:hypothetical protein